MSLMLDIDDYCMWQNDDLYIFSEDHEEDISDVSSRHHNEDTTTRS
jgi:hypothetical protein